MNEDGVYEAVESSNDIGKKVRVKSWKRLMDEYGYNKNLEGIENKGDTEYYFPDNFSSYCGMDGEVIGIEDKGKQYRISGVNESIPIWALIYIDDDTLRGIFSESTNPFL